MKQDRFLTGILIGIGVLVVIALTVFFARDDSQTYIAEGTPEQVAAVKGSYTGRFLAPLLPKATARRATR